LICFHLRISALFSCYEFVEKRTLSKFRSCKTKARHISPESPHIVSLEVSAPGAISKQPDVKHMRQCQTRLVPIFLREKVAAEMQDKLPLIGIAAAPT